MQINAAVECKAFNSFNVRQLKIHQLLTAIKCRRFNSSNRWHCNLCRAWQPMYALAPIVSNLLPNSASVNDVQNKNALFDFPDTWQFYSSQRATSLECVSFNFFDLIMRLYCDQLFTPTECPVRNNFDGSIDAKWVTSSGTTCSPPKYTKIISTPPSSAMMMINSSSRWVAWLLSCLQTAIGS